MSSGQTIALYTGITNIIIGVPCLAIGAALYGIGKLHDANQRNKFSLTGTRSEIGVAYNF